MNKKQIKIKHGWDLLTLAEANQIEQIMSADIPSDYKAVNLLSVLSGEDVSLFENMPLNQFTQIIKVIDFLTTEMPDVKVQNSYEINGHKYVVKADIPSISTAQYIDYQNYMREQPIDLQKVISVFLIPEGHLYNDGYDMNEVWSDINDMKIVDAKALGFFIQKQSALYTIVLENYLSNQMKKMKIPKTKIEEDLTPLKAMALSLLS